MSDTVLSVENLTKRYGSLCAVDDLSLEVREGEVFGLLGPNGAGKTTSISMMCGLLKPTSGRVVVYGEQITGGQSEMRVRVGVCPQEIVLWERLTAIEQLQFIGQMYDVPAAVARQRGLALLEQLGLTEKKDAQARTLSGGMKRRLNVAMALVHDPQIVVFDEPEAGLDPQSRIQVREFIRGIARHKTVILTTHNMDEADRVVDRLAIVDRGKLLVLDTPEALKNSVGEGDVVQIDLDGGEGGRERALEALEDLVDDLHVEVDGGVLTARALNIVVRLPELTERLRQAGIDVGGIHLRANTLEDVFIKLTGRSLRE